MDLDLREGRAHVAYLRRPFDDAGLHAVPVGHEAKLVCLPLTHRLAGRPEVTRADLEGEPLLDGRTRPVSSLDEKFELIASGQAVALVPVSVADSHPRGDLMYRPVTDAPPVELCLAVAEDEHDPLVRDFLEVAVDTLRSRAESAPLLSHP
ncbi:LysR substrate-binding domain-containing protein [Streptomyces sp. NPDC001941]|uniref:LysR substrate-binding domain-containing protein n=1 Tax=Streptomyces sp. NPDC001941 TaxID=3154659 RepID=UPI003328B7B5